MFTEHIEGRFLPNIGSDTLPALDINRNDNVVHLVRPLELAEEIRSSLIPKKSIVIRFDHRRY